MCQPLGKFYEASRDLRYYDRDFLAMTPLIRSVFLSLLFACAFSTVPSSASEAQWIEVHSPHFSVVTDAGERRGREVAIRFEQMRAVFAKLMNKANVNIPVPLQIVAFRSGKELRQVAPLWHGKPTEIAGLFQGGQDRSFIMLDMSVEDPWTVVFHEYAHQLMNGVLGTDVDPWFEEGFAVYFSSIEVNGKEALIGKIPDSEFETLRQGGIMRVSDLLRVQHNSSTYNESGDHRTVFYAESGMLVHYLYDNGLFPKLATYLDLKVNKGLPVEDAFQQAFGMNVGQFDKVFRSYLVSGQYKGYKLPTPTDIIEKGYTVKPLGPYESSTVVADIHLHSLDYHDRAISEFQEILKSDPNNAAALRGLGYAYLQRQDFPQAREYFRRAAEGNSNDARVHYYSALLMSRDLADNPNPTEMTHELETAIALDPSFADAYMLLGTASARQGDMAKAFSNMEKAVVLNPRNENYRFNLAQLYLSNRRVNQGMGILQTLSKSSDPVVAQRAKQSLTQAERFREAMQEESSEKTAAGGENQPSVVIRPMQVRKIPASETPDEVDDSALIASAQQQKEAVPGSIALAEPQLQGSIKFLKGTLESVDCSSPPGATLVFQAAGKAWTMKVPDTKHALVLGADTFSCKWQKQKASINYRQTEDTAGTVISIEIQ